MTENIRLYNGDSQEILKQLGDNIIDALVTDPPAGIGFMGKEWDKDKGGRDHWIAWLKNILAECYRVMKPGAYGFVWAFPKTSHWTAMAIEDAGFEIRDRVSHIFGNGFPKSLNVGVALDKYHGCERPILGYYRGISQVNNCGTNFNASQSDENGQTYVPITQPVSEDAKRWDGWGTGLRPAFEDWWLIRKPLSEKSVAANILSWGTGAINLSACKIGTEYRVVKSSKHHCAGNVYGFDKPIGEREYRGRWASDLILTHSSECSENNCAPDCPVRILNTQSGNHASEYFLNFHYFKKASPQDRNIGLHSANNTHPTVKSSDLMRYLITLITPPGGTILDPFMGSGSTGVGAKSLGRKFIGIEREPEYFRIAQERIMGTVCTEALPDVQPQTKRREWRPKRLI